MREGCPDKLGWRLAKNVNHSFYSFWSPRLLISFPIREVGGFPLVSSNILMSVPFAWEAV